MKYKYRLQYRPFGVGVYPTSDFIEWEDDGSKFGVLIYSRKLSNEELLRYELEEL
jgi:hypothetical protein